MSTKSIKSAKSDKSKKSESHKDAEAILENVPPEIANVIDAFATILAEDFFSASYDGAKKAAGNASLTEKYRNVVEVKIQNIKTSQTLSNSYVSAIIKKYNQYNKDEINESIMRARINEYLTPGTKISDSRQIKIFILMLHSVMEAVKLFVFDNIQLVIGGSDDKAELHKCANKIRKQCLHEISEFRLVKFPAMKAVEGGKAQKSQDPMRAALLQLTGENVKLKLDYEELESECTKLREEKITLLNMIANLRTQAPMMNQPQPIMNQPQTFIDNASAVSKTSTRKSTPMVFNDNTQKPIEPPADSPFGKPFVPFVPVNVKPNTIGGYEDNYETAIGNNFDSFTMLSDDPDMAGIAI
jgi:hypothetical protein